MAQIDITITITIPDGDPKPTVTVQTADVEEIKPDEAQPESIPTELREPTAKRPKSWDDGVEEFVVAEMARQKAGIKQKREPGNLPPRTCPTCNEPFAPSTTRQRFHNKQCKDRYGRLRKKAMENDDLDEFHKRFPIDPKIGKLSPKSRDREVVEPRGPQLRRRDTESTPVQPDRIHAVPNYNISQDSFYRQQLLKAAQRDKTYDRYLESIENDSEEEQ